MILLAFALGCGGKKTEAPPPVGWHQEEGWTLSCYFPPEYDKLNELDRSTPRVEPGMQLIYFFSIWSSICCLVSRVFISSPTGSTIVSTG